jgi:hypothetical protein
MQMQLPGPAADILPLALLASAAHPDPVWRQRLALHLDNFIASRRPIHSAGLVRDVLARHLDEKGRPSGQEPPALELAVRLVRLVFCRQTPRYTIRRVRIVRPLRCGFGRGLLVQVSRTRDLECSAYGPPFSPPPSEYHLFMGAIAPRVRALQEAAARLCARCIAEDGFRLEMTGNLPCQTQLVWLPRYSLLGDRPLDTTDLQVTSRDDKLEVRTTTPESIIRFSACLAQNQWLTLRTGQPYDHSVIVALSEFEGSSGTLPALALVRDGEGWLRVPPGALELGADEKNAIIRWLCPVESLPQERSVPQFPLQL